MSIVYLSQDQIFETHAVDACSDIIGQK